MGDQTTLWMHEDFVGSAGVRVQRYRPATRDELVAAVSQIDGADIRAAVVPLLDYEAAAKEIGMIVRGVLKFGAPKRKHAEIDTKLEGHWAGRIVGAALGLGEPTSQGGEK